MKRPSILVVGSFVMDLIVSTTRFPAAGETVLGTDFRMASGGKGANQAVQAARLGADVTMVGCVGRDSNGETMLEFLKNDGVDISHVAIHPSLPSAIGNVQIEQTSTGSQNRIIVVSGANMGIKKEDVEFLKDEMPSFDFVILQLEIPMEINSIIAKYAFDAGVPVMLNPAPAAAIPADVLNHTAYISPNETELALLCGQPVLSSENEQKKASAQKYAKLLKQQYNVKNVLVTLGKTGSMLIDSNGEEHICDIAKGITAVDPTAAGDSYVGAFCFATASGLDVDDAMKFASATSAITVSKYGAQPSLPKFEDVKNMVLKQGWTELADKLHSAL